MHVAIDARLVHYTRAGIGEYTLRLTRALAEAIEQAVQGADLMAALRQSVEAARKRRAGRAYRGR